MDTGQGQPRTTDHSPPRNLSGGKPATASDSIIARRYRLVLRMAPSSRGTLLDFGCGDGAQTLLFAHDFKDIIGIDCESAFVDAFRADLNERNLQDRVRVMCYDGNTLPLESDSVDAVVSFEVLEHVRNEHSALTEIWRVLRPGGWLAVSVPNRWWVFETHGASLPLLPWHRIPFFSWLPKSVHDRWARARIYRRREVVNLIRSHDFTVLESCYVMAPMDAVKWHGLRRLLRRTAFCGEVTSLPVKSTAILVVATKPL